MSIRTQMVLAAAVVGVGLIGGRANGATVSVNFQGDPTTTPMLSTDSTGAPGYEAANFNNVTGSSGSAIALTDSDGASSSITISSFTGGLDGTNGPDTAGSNAQERFFDGSLNAHYTDATVNLTGLPSTYDLVVYYTGGNSFADTRKADITASGAPSTTYYVAGIDSVYTDYTQSNSTTPPDPSLSDPFSSSTYASGNYVVFSGLTAPTETIVMGPESDRMGLVGFQVVSGVPEPVSLGGLLLGGLGLLARRHRSFGGR